MGPTGPTGSVRLRPLAKWGASRHEEFRNPLNGVSSISLPRDVRVDLGALSISTGGTPGDVMFIKLDVTVTVDSDQDVSFLLIHGTVPPGGPLPNGSYKELRVRSHQYRETSAPLTWVLQVPAASVETFRLFGYSGGADGYGESRHQRHRRALRGDWRQDAQIATTTAGSSSGATLAVALGVYT